MSLRETLRSWLGFGAGVAMGGFGCDYSPGSRADAAPDTTADTSPDNFDGGVDTGRDIQVDSMPDNAPDRFDGGVDSYESLPDLRHDTTPDTSICETTPRTFRGDGTYTVRPGDTITASNNVSFVVRNICDSYNPMLDCYIGAERVNSFPIIMHSDSWCGEFFGANIGATNVHLTGCGTTMDLMVSSVYPGPIESRRGLYDACIASAGFHSTCNAFVPNEATAAEISYRHETFQSITPFDADPIIGQYYLRQLTLARERLLPLFGISEHTPWISLRWYLPDDGPFQPAHADEAIYIPQPWPGTMDAALSDIRSEEAGGFADMASNLLVIHELSHLMRRHLSLSRWMEEGLATYAEAYATDKNNHHEPTFEGTIPLGTDIEIPGWGGRLKFSDYDDETETVLEDRLGRRFAAKSNLRLGDVTLVTFEHISADGVGIRIFEDSSFERNHGWIFGFKTECMDDGYVKDHGVYLDGEFYRTAVAPEFQPYHHLRDGIPSADAVFPFYETSFCVFENLRQLYGNEAIQRFLRIVEEGRERADDATCPPRVCLISALEAATGADLTEFLRRFDPPDASAHCYAATQHPSLYRGYRSCP